MSRGCDAICGGDAKRPADDTANAEKGRKQGWSPWCGTEREVKGVTGGARVLDVTVNVQEQNKCEDGAPDHDDWQKYPSERAHGKHLTRIR
jgi:hypothetical protein